jgi:DNA repair protein RecN (Recombination protein N)
MLCQLNIRHFAIIEALELEFNHGLICITGETGAGKSILLDALGLCLGGRAEQTMLHPKADKAILEAHFNVTHIQAARTWLASHDLDEEADCFIRRIITPNGRSRAYVNGHLVSISQLRQLGEHLVQIYGQHAHHDLLKPEQQRHLIDHFGQLDALVAITTNHYQQWATQRQAWSNLNQQVNDQRAQQQLLAYQLAELETFNPQPDEYEQLEQEHRQQAHGQDFLMAGQTALDQLHLHHDFNVQQTLAQVHNNLTGHLDLAPELAEVSDMISSAQINLEEAVHTLSTLVEQFELDPERLQWLEQRLSGFHDLARKHQIQPKQLATHFIQLQAQCTNLEDQQATLIQLEAAVADAHHAYHQAAKKLSASRQQASDQLARELEQQMRQLHMPHATFTIEVNYDQDSMHPHGSDSVHILMSSRLEQTPLPIKKVASGGELSRIGLTLQVLTCEQRATPTMIFDEVDVGISGATATVVGQLLQRLGHTNQIMCITHLPQVAGFAHQHILVKKDRQQTQTRILPLSETERLHELARLLAGDTITEVAIANARQLLQIQVAPATAKL